MRHPGSSQFWTKPLGPEPLTVQPHPKPEALRPRGKVKRVLVSLGQRKCKPAQSCVPMRSSSNHEHQGLVEFMPGS